MANERYADKQEPIAVIGLACRLPGNCNSPTAFWEYLVRGGCADTKPPSNRFNFEGHFDGSGKPGTMRSPGGMFLESIDPADIDARFFNLSNSDAISMDPQQRQLLEVVYEGLENAGISLAKINGQKYGCFVGSYSAGKHVDYHFLIRLTKNQITMICKHEIQKIEHHLGPWDQLAVQC
jgi:acyl transferase domain-containing protein